MMRIPVHKGIVDHPAPRVILATRPRFRIEPSERNSHNGGTTERRWARSSVPPESLEPVQTVSARPDVAQPSAPGIGEVGGPFPSTRTYGPPDPG
jgi:hypothetical protein